MGTNFTDITGTTPVSSVEINRRFYELDSVLEDMRDGKIYGASSELTISAGGAVTVTDGYHTIAANSGTADDLDTINGTTAGQLIVIAAASGDTITITSGVGNIVTQTGADIAMSGNQQYQLLNNGTNLVVINFVTGGLMDEITAHTEFSVAAASVDITSIPATYASLMLVCGLRSDQVATTDGLRLRFNADSGANYDCALLKASKGGVVVAENLGATAMIFDAALAGASATANYMGTMIITVHNYASITFPRHVQTSGYIQYGATTDDLYHTAGGGLWDDTASAIDQITLLPENGSNFDLGFYALYGLGAAA